MGRGAFIPVTSLTGRQIPTFGGKRLRNQTSDWMHPFLKSRLNFTLDLYKKLTSGLLQSVALPDYSGGGTVYQNLGEIENKGIELSINAVPVEQTDWRWDAAFNISYAKNTVSRYRGR